MSLAFTVTSWNYSRFSFFVVVVSFSNLLTYLYLFDIEISIQIGLFSLFGIPSRYENKTKNDKFKNQQKWKILSRNLKKSYVFLYMYTLALYIVDKIEIIYMTLNSIVSW